MTVVATGLACSSAGDADWANGEPADEGAAVEHSETTDGAEVLESSDALADDAELGAMSGGELGQAQQALWYWYPSFSSSCSDPTGTDSILAALAVSTARELRRWQPVLDFKLSYNMLALSDTGKARCADRACANTQALLDLQRDAASAVQVRPGVRNSPSILRTRLTWNYKAQKDCYYSWYNACRPPDHEFRFLRSEPGSCDMNFWFEVRTPAGALLSSVSRLQESLIWVDEEDNSYIKFQTNGSNIAIDPTYGLNDTGSTTTGSCSAACTKITSQNVAGQCCSCNGTKKYARSLWSPTTYLCQ